MMSSLKIKQQVQSLLRSKSVDDLAKVLKFTAENITLLSISKKYEVYKIPKKDGSFRMIEDPYAPLKALQKRLNEVLQCYYATIRPSPVYGFCISTSPDKPLNIKTNAQRHVGNPWMINIDLKDFFHHISEKRVQNIFSTNFKHWDKNLVKTMAAIATYKHRLPMGAPTSPVLSNLACINLDHELQNFTKNSGITFTRFADDFTFSAHHELNKNDIDIIFSALHHYGFLENQKKVVIYPPDDIKIVTGLVVGNDDVSLPKDYIPQLLIEIDRLKNILSVEKRYQTGMSNKKLQLFKQEIEGKINFATTILGNQHVDIQHIEQAYIDATAPEDDYLSMNWLEMPYSL